MAFPSISAQQELNNRKILEDLQIKKQQLQKGVSPVASTNTFVSTEIISGTVNPTARQAWFQASNQSFGYFILQQDSLFGNSILPVLPRLENQKQT